MPSANFDPVRNCFLFQEMTDADLNLLAGYFSEKQVAEGMTVFLENMTGESLYLIREGVVRVSRMIAEGEEKTLVVLGPEDVFGEMALLDGGPRSASARVVEAASLLALRRTDFDRLCAQHPGLGLRLLRNIARAFSQRVRSNNEDYRTMLLWATEETS